MPTPAFDPSSWQRRTESVRSVARALLADPHLADDVAQAAWVTALGHRERLDDRGWLRRVVRSRAVDAFRRRRSQVRIVDHLPDERPSREASADKTAEQLEVQRLVIEAVQALDEPYRTAVAYVHLEGRSVPEAA
ncbi:MAG: sigma-70 family RNA polymerase sigma factor, partial [Planctomycetota bacterium]